MTGYSAKYSWSQPFGPDGPARDRETAGNGGGHEVSWHWSRVESGSPKGLITAAKFDALARDGGAFVDTYGFYAEAIGYGTAVMRLPFDIKHIRPGGTVAGPSLMALADFAAYAALMGQLGPIRMAVTTNLNISFLRAPPRADILAAARVVGNDRFLAHLEVVLATEGDSAESAESAEEGRKAKAGPYEIAHVMATYATPQD